MPFDLTQFNSTLQNQVDGSLTESKDILLLAKAVGTLSETADLNSLLAAKADLVNGKIPDDQLPPLAIVEYNGVVASEAEMLALTDLQKGDWVTRSDSTSTWVVTGDDSSQISSWTQISASSVDNLESLSNVVLESSAATSDKELLTYDSANSIWINRTATESSLASTDSTNTFSATQVIDVADSADALHVKNTNGSALKVEGEMTTVGHIIPETNSLYDLGSAEKKFRHLYLSSNSLHIGDETISLDSGVLQIEAAESFESTSAFVAGEDITSSDIGAVDHRNLHTKSFILDYSRNGTFSEHDITTIKVVVVDGTTTPVYEQEQAVADFAAAYGLTTHQGVFIQTLNDADVVNALISQGVTTSSGIIYKMGSARKSRFNHYSANGTYSYQTDFYPHQKIRNLTKEIATESVPGLMSAEDKKKVEENSLLVAKDSYEVLSADTSNGFTFDKPLVATVGKKLVIKNPKASSSNHPLAFSSTDPNSVITQITENVVDEQFETSQEISLIITEELVSSLSNGVLYYYCRVHSSSAAMKGKIVIKEGGTEEFSQWSNGIVGPVTLLLPVKEKQIHYETIIPTSDFTLNLTGVATGLTVDTSFNDSLAAGESMTVVFMMDLGATPYKVSDLQIDSATQSVKWSFGMTPEGTANSKDVYSYTILKTADSTYSVLGNYTSYL